MIVRNTHLERDSYAAPAGARSGQREAADVVDVVLRVAQQLRRLLNERLEKCGLNDVRFGVLRMVAETADRGGCSQAELAERLDQTESSISMLVDRMRADRLLHRLRTPSDRRRRRLVLTEEGRAVLEAARREYATFMAATREVLRDEGALRQLLEPVSAALDEVKFVPMPATKMESSGFPPAA